MTGKLFVHIGLPKTATTTLQMDFFPAITRSGVTYLGIYQPREASPDPLFTRIYEAIKTGQHIVEVRDEIHRRLQTGESMIASEEMITASQGEATFEMKLKNLSRLLDGLDYQIILTVREPASALFSYYVERYDEFYKNNIGFIDSAIHEEPMLIFHYKKLVNELVLDFKKDRINVYKFEDIIKGRLQGMCDLIAPGMHQENEFHLVDHNKKVASVNVVHTNKSRTAGDSLQRQIIPLKQHNPNLYHILNPVVKMLRHLLDRIPLSELKIERPSSSEMNRLREFLREETEVLHSAFGIRY